MERPFSAASAPKKQPNAEQRLNELQLKYQPVLNALEQHQVQLQDLCVQDNKLVIKGTVASQGAKNKIWDQIKLVDADYETDLTCDLTCADERLAGGSW